MLKMKKKEEEENDKDKGRRDRRWALSGCLWHRKGGGGMCVKKIKAEESEIVKDSQTLNSACLFLIGCTQGLCF